MDNLLHRFRCPHCGAEANLVRVSTEWWQLRDKVSFLWRESDVLNFDTSGNDPQYTTVRTGYREVFVCGACQRYIGQLSDIDRILQSQEVEYVRRT